MLTILMGRARTGKTEALLNRIRELGEESSQILLVPEHASHLAEVDLCRAGGPTVSRHTEVLSFHRLGDRVLTATGGISQTALDAGGKLLTLQKALMEVAPELTVYRRPSQKSTFLQQILALFDELHAYEVTPAVLCEKAEMVEGATREKLHDLSLLYTAYEARLCRPGLDVRDPMTRMCDKLEESGYVAGKDLFIDGFTYFNAQEQRALRIFLRQARSVTVALLGDLHSREEIFDSSRKTFDQLCRLAQECGRPVQVQECKAEETAPLRHLERRFFDGSTPYGKPQTAIRLREADSTYAEVEQTAAEIRALVAAGKCRYRDITVATRHMDAYQGMIETVFARYEIPAYLSRRSDILEKPVLSLLTGVLAAISGGYEYEDMFRWLKTGLAGLTPEECDLLENYVLKWEVYGQMWLRDVDWTENPDGYGAPWDEIRQSRLARVNRLRRKVREPLNRLAQGLKEQIRAAGKIQVLYSFVEELGLQGVLEEQMRQQAAAGRLQEAEETAQLWDILCGVLDQFVEIVGDEQMELEEFIRLFRLILTQYSVGTIPVALDQVAVTEITRNDRHSTKYEFLLGANDHVLPDVGQNGGILSDDDRKELALQGVELAPAGMEAMGIELQNLYAALSQPTEGLIVSYPMRDAGGAQLRPAFVVERLRAMFPGLQVERASFDRSYRKTAAIPALEMAGEEPGGPLWRHFAAQPDYASRIRGMEQAAAMKRGALSRDAVQRLYGKRINLSASRMERMRTCHFAYFMEYGLRAKPRAAAAFAAPEIGTFLHYLLENVTRDVMGQGGFAEVTDEELHKLVELYIRRYEEQELMNFQGRNARFRYLFARLRKTACAVIDQVAEEMRHSDFKPMKMELSFGDGQDLPAVVISEPDVEVRLGGKVDRVDGWIKDGKLYLRVVDYKTGKKKFDLDHVRMGLNIQMLLYLFALQQHGRDYFGQEVEPAGVLYLPARNELLSQERSITPEKLAAAREAELRRSGLVLSDPAVLQAMEHEALTIPHFLPLKVSKDGTISGDIASAERLGKLSAYVDRLLHQIALELRQGNIDADPCCKGEEDSPCRFCDWVDACHFQDGRDTDHINYILSVKNEEFWAKLEEGDA